MENGEEQQKEFFEFEDRPKKKFSAFGNIFQKNDFENRYLVTLSPERLVFVAIGIVMLLVLVYALGVERGKSLAAGAVIPQRETQKAVPAVRIETKTEETKTAPAPVPAEPAGTPGPAPETPAAFYTIVACTFTKDSTAAAEANRLKAEGLDAYIYQSGQYYLICVGRFPDSAGAKGELARVRRYFKDAYIKYRQQ